MKNVLFVCLGNSCRSQIAEGFARVYGKDVLNCASAGLSSTTSVALETLEVMAEKSIDISDQFPKDFEAGIAERYDFIVNISGFELPPVHGPVVVEWAIPDPYGEAIEVHREVRDEIEQRVLKLISDIQEKGTVTQYIARGPRIAPDLVKRQRIWQRFAKWL